MIPLRISAPRALRCARVALAASTFAALTLLAPAIASAEEPRGDTATAQTLFEEGRRLMEAKDYAQACPKLAESQRLRPGTGTLLNLALCSEGLGRSATAWGYFKEVLFASKKENNEAREAFAQEHISALEPRLSKLQVNAEATPGLVIRRDGQEIPAAALGTPIPVDPGLHEIEATAPSYSVWSTSIKVGETADLKTVAIPKLTPAPVEDKGEIPAPGPGGSALRTTGFVVGGVGVVALGLGGVFGLLASGQASDAEADKALCPDKKCSPAGRKEVDAASTKAILSTVGVGVGVAAIGAGLVLILTSGSSPPAPGKEAPRARPGAPRLTARVVPAIGPGGGGALVIGAF